MRWCWSLVVDECDECDGGMVGMVGRMAVDAG